MASGFGGSDGARRLSALKPVPQTKRIVLVGGGRNANNLLGLFTDVGIEIAAILDDRPGATIHGHHVTAIDGYDGPEWTAIMTVADPSTRRSLDQRCALLRAHWTAYLDPRSVISPFAEIGDGTFVAPLVACADVTVGRHASIMTGVVLGARVRVGDYTSVMPSATVASDAQIGHDCVIGMGARIEAGVRIGNNCRVAPNVVVRRDMPDFHMAASKTATRLFRRRRLIST